jgi:hypothetical protein
LFYWQSTTVGHSTLTYIGMYFKKSIRLLFREIFLIKNSNLYVLYIYIYIYNFKIKLSLQDKWIKNRTESLSTLVREVASALLEARIEIAQRHRDTSKHSSLLFWQLDFLLFKYSLWLDISSEEYFAYWLHNQRFFSMGVLSSLLVGMHTVVRNCGLVPLERQGNQALPPSMGESLKLTKNRNIQSLKWWPCGLSREDRKRNRQVGCTIFITLGKQTWLRSKDLYGYGSLKNWNFLCSHHTLNKLNYQSRICIYKIQLHLICNI